MKNNYEYRLEDPQDDNEIDSALLVKKPSNNKKKILIITIIICIFIIIGLILFFILKKKYGNKDKGEIIYDYYFFKNISTAENKKIRNSFKVGGENYNKILGNINNGNDYEESDRDNFDLCIPYNITKRKSKYNKILLMIHGGGWVHGQKMNVEEICKNLEKLGFISASMSYTLFNGTYKETNMFRLIDEITSTIKGIKLLLKKEGFDENKLELAIGGGSAGAHLSMLYSYMINIKDHPIPIKFIYNTVGPVTLEPKYYLSTKIYNDSLNNIEPEDIENALTNDKLMSMNENPNVLMKNNHLLSFMNLALGREFNDSFNEMFSDLEKRVIDENSEKYQDLINKAKYVFPETYVNNTSIPTLCVYGGQDEYVGVANYAQLKKKFREYNNEKNITLIYYKYGHHNVNDPVCEDSKIADAKLYQELSRYIQTYFTQDDN